MERTVRPNYQSTVEELVKGDNWEAAYPNKQISVVLLKHKVVAPAAAASARGK